MSFGSWVWSWVKRVRGVSNYIVGSCESVAMLMGRLWGGDKGCEGIGWGRVGFAQSHKEETGGGSHGSEQGPTPAWQSFNRGRVSIGFRSSRGIDALFFYFLVVKGEEETPHGLVSRMGWIGA